MDFKKELNAVHSLMERTCPNYKRVIKEDMGEPKNYDTLKGEMVSYYPTDLSMVDLTKLGNKTLSFDKMMHYISSKYIKPSLSDFYGELEDKMAQNHGDRDMRLSSRIDYDITTQLMFNSPEIMKHIDKSSIPPEASKWLTENVIKEDVDSDLTKLIDLMSEHFADISTEFGTKMNEFKYDLFSRYDIENPSEVKAALKYILDVAEQRDMITLDSDGKMIKYSPNERTFVELLGRLYQTYFGEQLQSELRIDEDDIINIMSDSFETMNTFKDKWENIKKNVHMGEITPEKGDEIIGYLESQLSTMKRDMFDIVLNKLRERGVTNVAPSMIGDAFKSFVLNKIQDIFNNPEFDNYDSPNPEPLD